MNLLFVVLKYKLSRCGNVDVKNDAFGLEFIFDGTNITSNSRGEREVKKWFYGK